VKSFFWRAEGRRHRILHWRRPEGGKKKGDEAGGRKRKGTPTSRARKDGEEKKRTTSEGKKGKGRKKGEPGLSCAGYVDERREKRRKKEKEKKKRHNNPMTITAR